MLCELIGRGIETTSHAAMVPLVGDRQPSHSGSGRRHVTQPNEVDPLERSTQVGRRGSLRLGDRQSRPTGNAATTRATIRPTRSHLAWGRYAHGSDGPALENGSVSKAQGNASAVGHRTVQRSTEAVEHVVDSAPSS